MAAPTGPGQGPQYRAYPPQQYPGGRQTQQYPQQYQPQQYGPGHGQQQYGPGPYGPPPRPPAGRPQPGHGRHGAPPPPPPPPPAKRGSTGKIVAIVVGVVVVLVVLGGIAVGRMVGGVADSVAGAGGLAEGASTECAAVPTADVDAALGGTYDVIQLGGIGDFAGPVLDSRVLADAPTCWAVESGDTDTGGRLARIARYAGPDAAARFAAEKTTAMGSSEDRGNGITVSTEGYYAGDVPAGDEAFCTSGDFLGSAGALVRRGDTLVYVSTTAAGGGAASPPQIDLEGGKIAFGTDKANCDLAVALAGKTR
jgi:hypothetical protein